MRYLDITLKPAALWVIGFFAFVILVLSPIALAGPQEDADALSASEKWAEAATAYEALLQTDASNATNWFNLGRCRQHLENNSGAVDAYNKAIDVGYQPAAQARIYLARVHMLLEDTEKALLELEKLPGSGANFRTLQAIEEFSPLSDEPRYAAVISALTPCNTSQYRQFDFWLGEWDVTPAGAASPSARNVISRQHGGCLLREDYVAGAFIGMSLNFYDSTREKWHQTWMSNAGGALYIEGGLNEDGQMVLTDEGLPSSVAAGTINKITWTPNPDGSVRQFWETSTDDGETWSATFDGLYTKAEPAE